MVQTLTSSGQPAQRGVQRGRLARSGGAGQQDDAVRLRHQLFPALAIVRAEAQRFERLDGGVGVEDAHHHLLAEGRGQRRQAHLDFDARRVAGLDAAVEWAPLLDHVHAAEQLDARDHRVHHAGRQLIHGVHHAVDAEADHAAFAARLEVDVGGALVEGVLPQPVDHLHDALVVRVELLGAAAEFDELLETRQARVLARLDGIAHRARQGIELGRVARQLDRADDDELHHLARVRFDLGHPGHVERLTGGDRHLAQAHGQRQRVAALGVVDRHDLGDPAHVDPQRVDAQIWQATAQGQPFGQRFDVEQAAAAGARARAQQVRTGQPHERVLSAVAGREAARGLLGIGDADDGVFAQPLEQRAPVELARDDGDRLGRSRAGGGGGSVHAGGRCGRRLRSSRRSSSAPAMMIRLG
jgi:hypothetical protein